MMLWDCAFMKEVKQGHVSSRNSVGGLVKVGELWVLGGGGLYFWGGGRSSLIHSMFMVPCILKNLVNKSPTGCSLFHFVYFRSTCFEHGACPSSGVVCKNCRGSHQCVSMRVV